MPERVGGARGGESSSKQALTTRIACCSLGCAALHSSTDCPPILRLSLANRLLTAEEEAQPSGHRVEIDGFSMLVCPVRRTSFTFVCRGEQQQWPRSIQQVIEQASRDRVTSEACAENDPTRSSKPAKTALSSPDRLARVFAIDERNPINKLRSASIDFGLFLNSKVDENYKCRGVRRGERMTPRPAVSGLQHIAVDPTPDLP